MPKLRQIAGFLILVLPLLRDGGAAGGHGTARSSHKVFEDRGGLMRTREKKKALPPPRQFERYSPYRDLSMTYEGRSEEIPLRVPDLSEHGMFINTPREFPEGSVLKLKFVLTRTGYTVNARGEVRYCLAGIGIGVEFVEVSEEAREAIAEELEMAEPATRRRR